MHEPQNNIRKISHTDKTLKVITTHLIHIWLDLSFIGQRLLLRTDHYIQEAPCGEVRLTTIRDNDQNTRRVIYFGDLVDCVASNSILSNICYRREQVLQYICNNLVSLDRKMLLYHAKQPFNLYVYDMNTLCKEKVLVDSEGLTAHANTLALGYLMSMGFTYSEGTRIITTTGTSLAVASARWACRLVEFSSVKAITRIIEEQIVLLAQPYYEPILTILTFRERKWPKFNGINRTELIRFLKGVWEVLNSHTFQRMTKRNDNL